MYKPPKTTLFKPTSIYGSWMHCLQLGFFQGLGTENAPYHEVQNRQHTEQRHPYTKQQEICFEWETYLQSCPPSGIFASNHQYEQTLMNLCLWNWLWQGQDWSVTLGQAAVLGGFVGREVVKAVQNSAREWINYKGGWMVTQSFVHSHFFSFSLSPEWVTSFVIFPDLTAHHSARSHSAVFCYQNWSVYHSRWV